MSGVVRTLYVDDDEELAKSTARLLEAEDDELDVATAQSGSEALTYLETATVDCIVSDYKMDGMDGLDLLREVRRAYPDLPFLILTGKGSEAVASEAISAGATDYLRKRLGANQHTLLANRIKSYANQRKTEQKRRRQLEAIETAREGIGILSEDNEFVFVNDAYADMYGYDRDELIGEHWEILYSDAETRFANEEIIPTVESGGYWHGESVGKRADGTTFPVDHVVSATNEGGLVCTIRDKTDKKEFERELAWENERYRSLFEHTNDAVAWLEYEGADPMIREANPTFRQLFEAEGADVTGEHLDDVVADDDRQSQAREISKQVKDGSKMSGQLSRNTVDGPREFLWEAVPLEDPETDEVEHFHIVYKDITEQRERQTELEAQNERLEQFRRVASHDLRNPLNVALTRLDLAKAECGSEHLDDVQNALDRMERLIEDLLLIAKGGDVVADASLLDLESVAKEAWSVVDIDGATLQTETDLVVRVDRSRLRQLLENLFANAVEHGVSDEPSVADAPDDAVEPITVTVGSLPDGFYVADDGVGIPADERGTVFETGYSTDEEGTGFGLSIVSQIADSHGWEVRLTEADQGGARFEFTGVETDI
jgi:PAS domain S-box-containing protein